MEREKQEILGGIYRIPSIGTLPFNRLYPSLSRDTGAKILILVAKLGDPNPSEGPDTAVPTIVPLDSNYQDLSLQSLVLHGKLPVILEPEFALDGFFCEWAYVLDLDRNVLEVYGGYGNLHHGCFDKFFEGDYRNVHLEFTFEALRGMTKSEFESAFCAQNEDEGSMYHEDEGLIPCSD